ncbi:hypothetical protein [Coleofasciculus sp. G2-EDA-02]|uniref:hypothetical protein n=1 Tax=Coleofasciculus sp. G2-EDA-02 TaxID=3069529 RepID=UPI0033012583
MTLQIDVTGSGKWNLTYTVAKQASEDRKKFNSRYKRLIDPFDIPIIFESHVIAVATRYLNAPTTWYNAGQLIQLAIGATINDPDAWGEGYGESEPIIISRKNVRLNQSLEIFFMEPVGSELRLGFNPRPWIPEFSMGIYEFLGTTFDTTEEMIEATRAQLTTMEAKINVINDKL